MKAKQGNAVIEAALVLPLIILISAALIRAGSDMSSRVIETSSIHTEQARAECEGGMVDTEDIMRGRWVLR